eukprot:CAMPEP_0177650872 /NCGR_PEP_ID=MMETSP0447-20121125/12200_1 /TAXON_ID=0 /ORGANISM="Stygamoeba regulata, Strain BSH-02190019" /LENGTH=75 /DNA_ID=CAMNT_0019153823 /DNA_START=717 /DNA_END=945 /DNA_ORIENTATION=+
MTQGLVVMACPFAVAGSPAAATCSTSASRKDAIDREAEMPEGDDMGEEQEEKWRVPVVIVDTGEEEAEDLNAGGK